MLKVGDRVAKHGSEPGREVTVLRESNAGTFPYLVRAMDGRWTWEAAPDRVSPDGSRWSEIAWLARGGFLVVEEVVNLEEPEAPAEDLVNTPPHYAKRVPGIECIQVTQHFNFNRGNAIKYVWRAGEKGDLAKEIEDLNKARKYLDFEITRLGGEVR